GLVFDPGLRWLFRGGDRIAGAPTVFFLAGAETGEIAAAGGAAVRCGAASQHNHGPARRMVVLLAPGSQFLPVTARTPRKFPVPGGPHAGRPAVVTTAAAQRVDSENRAKAFRKILFLRDPDVACATLWTGKLH